MTWFNLKFFHPKPKPELKEALSMARQAIEIAYQYKRNAQYHPSEEELPLFDELGDLFWHNYTTAQSIKPTS